MEISFHSRLDSNTVIATQFCTWHDSCAAGPCAKLCCDLMPGTGITARQYFPLNLNCGQNFVSETDPADLIWWNLLGRHTVEILEQAVLVCGSSSEYSCGESLEMAETVTQMEDAKRHWAMGIFTTVSTIRRDVCVTEKLSFTGSVQLVTMSSGIAFKFSAPDNAINRVTLKFSSVWLRGNGAPSRWLTKISSKIS